MKKVAFYKYLGTNGIIESLVHLEDIYYVRTYCLQADQGKILTDGITKTKTVKVSEDEVDKWTEINDDSSDGQN